MACLLVALKAEDPPPNPELAPPPLSPPGRMPWRQMTLPQQRPTPRWCCRVCATSAADSAILSCHHSPHPMASPGQALWPPPLQRQAS